MNFFHIYFIGLNKLSYIISRALRRRWNNSRVASSGMTNFKLATYDMLRILECENIIMYICISNPLWIKRKFNFSRLDFSLLKQHWNFKSSKCANFIIMAPNNDLMGPFESQQNVVLRHNTSGFMEILVWPKTFVESFEIL